MKNKTIKNLIKNKAKFNLLFVLVFLNIWDFVVNRDFFNGMVMGIVMFLPAAFFWFIGTVRAAAVVTLISLFEFTVLSVFIIDGLSAGLKSAFWIPYLVMVALNLFWGLKIYTNDRKKERLKVR